MRNQCTYFKQLLYCTDPRPVYLETRQCTEKYTQTSCGHCPKVKPEKWNHPRKKKTNSVQKFVKQGANPKPRKINNQSILHIESPTDWHINFDFHHNRTIPPETQVDTLSRPDIVIYSVSKKRLIWLENTVPLERNIVDANLRKVRRYANLKTNLKLKGWTVHDFAIEIGALGFIAKSFNYALRKLGFGSTQRKFIRKKAGITSLRSSYYIWNSRFSHNFTKPTLVVEPKSNSFPPLKRNPVLETTTTLPPYPPPITKRQKTRTPTVNHPFTTPKKTIELEQKKSPISTISRLKKEIMDMSPIDTTKWNGMENYSPASRNFLKKIPLFDLDEKMGMNPFSNSLKMYDPT